MLLSLLLGAPEVKINAQSLNSSLPGQNSSQSQSSISTNGNAQQADENITLVGQIGPYDPSQGDQDDPNFNDFTGADLEGTLPTDNYFTISVTLIMMWCVEILHICNFPPTSCSVSIGLIPATPQLTTFLLSL